MSSVKKSVPDLRFPGFEDEWTSSELNQLLEISKNKFNPVDSQEEYQCVELEHLDTETGNLLGYTSSSSQKSTKNKFSKGEVLFGKLRPYLKKYWFSTFDGVCSSEIWVLRGKNVSNSYIFNLIQTDKFNQIANISSGSKMPRADWSYMSEVPFSFPTLPEQEKIAAFLSDIDSKIEKTGQKKSLLTAYKKGMMQKLFSCELRFKDDNGNEFPAWQEKRAGKLFLNRVEKGEAGLPIYSVTQNDGMVKRSSLDRDFDDIQDPKGNRKAVKGDIAYNMMRMWQGALGVACEDSMVSPAYVILQPTEEVDSTFYSLLFKMPRSLHRLTSHSQGLTSDRLRLYYKDFAQIKLPLPCKEEQQKIAAFLTDLDTKITAVDSELNQLKEFKRGLLQKMFV